MFIRKYIDKKILKRRLLENENGTKKKVYSSSDGSPILRM